MTFFKENDGTIISKTLFIPHKYESLDSVYKQVISENDYENCIAWYNQCTDVEFFKIKYKSDNFTVVGILAQPKHMTKERYPLVIYNRGGSGDSGKIIVCTLKDDIYFLVKQGYVVLASQYRGNDGSEGKDEIGGGDINDVLNLYKVAQNLGYIDLDNIFMLGFSRGGLMAFLALKHKMPLRAVATVSSVNDIFTFIRHRPETEEEILYKHLPRMPTHKEEEYAKRSAVCWAHELNVPILLIHAQDDPIVNVEEAHNLVAKLKEFGKTFKFILYTDGGHMIDAHREEIHKTILDWFSRYRK